MISAENIQQFKQFIDAADHLLVVQADNPDGDSLCTALALEELLGEQGKQVSLFCSVDMPSYLRYVAGWDRVSNELPGKFDASIIVDTSTKTLLEKLEKHNQTGWLATKPCLVLDHHTGVVNTIDFADISIIDSAYASTGDMLYFLAKQLEWPVSIRTAELIMITILGDTQGLSNSLASSQTYRTMAELIETGVDRPALEERRRLAGKMPRDILLYKATLITRVRFSYDDKIATVTIPLQEIKSYSPLYNPIPLIQADVLQTENVLVAIVFKQYDNGRITGAIRCNNSAAIADKLAEAFGGGGHPYAAGFKDTSGKPLEELKQSCIEKAQELLQTID